MILLTIDPRKIDRSLIKKAAGKIKVGGLVAFPTETVYGLGADATNEKAVEKIFKVKNRPNDNPLIVHISDLYQLEEIAEEIPKKAKSLIDKFWPGPLTIVLKKKKTLAPAVTAGLATFAVRMPANEIALELIREAKVPVAAPSANKSGKPSPTRAEHVIEDLGEEIDVVLDGGDTEIGIESTVIDLSAKKPQLLRPGAIGKSEIEKIIGCTVSESPKKKERVKSPGMKYSHYSPKAKVYLVSGRFSAQRINDLAVSLGKKNCVLAFEETCGYYRDKGVYCIEVSKKNDPSSYARKIFAIFRQLDNEEVENILIESPQRKDEWVAVLDRLKKAAFKKIKT